MLRFLRKLPRGRASSPVPLEEIRRGFEQAAADEEHFPSRIDPRIYHVKLILEHCGEVGTGRVLDVGCGKGRFARLVKERNPGATVVGFDLALAMLGAAPAGVRACGGSMTALPFRDGAFDAAFAVESLEHAVDIERAVAEICRVVKRGGRVAIIDKNAEQWGRLETPRWEQWFHRAELERLLGRHCRQTTSRPISYWEDVAPDGLFLAWLAVR